MDKQTEALRAAKAFALAVKNWIGGDDGILGGQSANALLIQIDAALVLPAEADAGAEDALSKAILTGWQAYSRIQYGERDPTSYSCRHCGAWGDMDKRAVHKPGCVVLIAESRATTTPPTTALEAPNEKEHGAPTGRVNENTRQNSKQSAKEK